MKSGHLLIVKNPNEESLRQLTMIFKEIVRIK
jgi:hypothetical protein